jgi:cytochrome c oxidase assembly protein subunit 15
MGFQAWLGKTVIKSFQNNHSHAGCIINCSASIDCYLYRKKNITKHLFSIKSLIDISWSLGLTIIQIVLGTTVREHVTSSLRLVLLSYVASKSYYSILYPSLFSIVLLTNLYLFYLNRKLTLGFNKINWVIAILLLKSFLEFQCIILHSHSELKPFMWC